MVVKHVKHDTFVCAVVPCMRIQLFVVGSFEASQAYVLFKSHSEARKALEARLQTISNMFVSFYV